jgi:peptidoglycan/xylan/chitin deacetylase (PgdA/CDA1 family)
MSPQSLLDPSPATGDVTGSIGRHRRPESLADVSRARNELTDVPRPRNELSLRQAGQNERRIAVPAQRPTRSARHQRHVPSHRAPADRPAAGNHRAPGTLPIESWLLMGRRRQQALLASLVAAGVLMLAIPADGQRSAVDVVDAAAQRALGGHAAAQKKPKGGADRDTGGKRPSASPSASAPAQDTPPGEGPADGDRQTMTGNGPSRSLLTTGTSAVALTFDDGPDPVQTPRILALLDQYQVKATFCLVGQNVQRHPEIVRQIVAAGHTLCNHTWNHSLTIGKDSAAQIRADLAKTNAAIEAAVPGTPVPFFRAPCGNFTDRLVKVAASTGMSSLYWAVDPRDWDHTTDGSDDAHVDRIVAVLHANVQPGSIILSHDFNQPDTIEAYEKLLPWLTSNFSLGIPGGPAPATPSTPPSSSPTPAEPPATTDPTPESTPANSSSADTSAA